MKDSAWQFKNYGLAALRIAAVVLLLWLVQFVAVATAQDNDADCASYLPDDAITVSEVTDWRDGLDPAKAADGIKRWNRVLATLGEDTEHDPMTAELARDIANRLKNERWDRTARTLEALEQCKNAPDPTPTATSTPAIAAPTGKTTLIVQASGTTSVTANATGAQSTL